MMDVQGMDVEMVTVVRAIEGLSVVTLLSPLAASCTIKPEHPRQRRAVVGAGTMWVCSNFWVLKGLYYL